MRASAERLSSVLLLAVTAIALLSGCSANAQEPAADPVVPVLVDPPGIYETPGPEVRAVGIFDWMPLEGGFWVVVGVADTMSAESLVIAVIPNAEELGIDLAGYRGRYVEVVGTLVDDPSIRMAGPEIEAHSISGLVEDDPADSVQ